jgi:hypothetical protein
LNALSITSKQRYDFRTTTVPTTSCNHSDGLRDRCHSSVSSKSVQVIWRVLLPKQSVFSKELCSRKACTWFTHIVDGVAADERRKLLILGVLWSTRPPSHTTLSTATVPPPHSLDIASVCVPGQRMFVTSTRCIAVGIACPAL